MFFFLAFFIQERRNDLLDQENIELMPIPSTENIDDDEEEEDTLDLERMELLPISATSQGNSNASAILITIEKVDDDDDEEEESSSNFLEQKKTEVLPMPSTSQGNSNDSAILISTDNADYDDDDEEADSFTTQKLFSFAWQIAKGMVGTKYNYLEIR